MNNFVVILRYLCIVIHLQFHLPATEKSMGIIFSTSST
jgi:hypothetical protein